MTCRHIKILLIDDDEDAIVQLKAILNKIEGSRYTIDWARSATDGLDKIRADDHDVYLVDYRLGATDGLHVIRNAANDGIKPAFIILTGQAERDVDIAAMELGASDYLEKDHLSPDLLERSIRYALGRQESATKLERINHELKMKNEELQNFVYTVSHDLKSPVVTLAGFAGHFKRDVEVGRTDRLMMYADRFLSAANRMRRNVDDLLELSRAGCIADTLLEVDMRLLTKNIVFEMTDIIRERKVEIKIADTMPFAVGDGKRIRRAISELLANAVHHGAGTGATMIQIGTHDRANYVQYYVQDNGGGVMAEHQSLIFDLFQRKSHRSGGNGMGLALVRRIAEAHEGRTWVESGDGKTTFYFELPKRRKPEAIHAA